MVIKRRRPGGVLVLGILAVGEMVSKTLEIVTTTDREPMVSIGKLPGKTASYHQGTGPCCQSEWF